MVRQLFLVAQPSFQAFIPPSKTTNRFFIKTVTYFFLLFQSFLLYLSIEKRMNLFY